MTTIKIPSSSIIPKIPPILYLYSHILFPLLNDGKPSSTLHHYNFILSIMSYT